MNAASSTFSARRNRSTRAVDARRPAVAASRARRALADRVAAASIAGYVLQLANHA